MRSGEASAERARPPQMVRAPHARHPPSPDPRASSRGTGSPVRAGTVRPWRSRSLRRLERADAALPQFRQHALDMLAGAEPVDPVVGTATRVERLVGERISTSYTLPPAERTRKLPKYGRSRSRGSIWPISVRPRQRRRSISSASLNSQPISAGARSRVAWRACAPRGDRMSSVRAVRAGKLWLDVQHGGGLAFESRLPDVGRSRGPAQDTEKARSKSCVGRRLRTGKTFCKQHV